MPRFSRATAILITILIAIPQTALAQVWVDGYYRDDGTYVEGHYRTEPNGIPYDNYSFPGNYNPNTGEVTSGDPETYLENYYDTEEDAQVIPDRTSISRTEVQASDSERYVRVVQKALKLLRHNPGPVDGLYGRKTKRAVRSFQRSAGLAVDGVVGKETLGALVRALKRVQDVSSQKNGSTLSGRWRGSYTCGQGRTGLTLSLERSGRQVEGKFNFYPLEENPDVPSGAYSVKGKASRGGHLTLSGVEWINKPSGYRMVDVNASIGPDGKSIGGTICGNPFSLIRGPLNSGRRSGSEAQRENSHGSTTAKEKLLLQAHWSGKLVRPGETWKVDLAFSRDGARLSGASRKSRKGASVLWKVNGRVLPHGLSLEEERVLDEDRLPSMPSRWSWCARSGKLKFKNEGATRKLVGVMRSDQDGCPNAKIKLNYEGKIADSPTEVVSVEKE